MDNNKPTFAEWGSAQLDIMARALAHADSHGYITIVHGQNDDARSGKHLYRYLNGALEQWIKQWGRAHGRRCVVLDVYMREDTRALASFHFQIPRRATFKPINVALQLMGREAASRWHERHMDNKQALIFVKFSDYYEYRGTGRDNFEMVLRILDMDHHREILTSTFRVSTKNKE